MSGNQTTLHRDAYNTFFYYIRDVLVSHGWLEEDTNQGIATLVPVLLSSKDKERIVTREHATGSSDEIVLPVVALGDGNFSKRPIQIGGGETETHLQLVAMIYAENHAQRRDLSNQVYDALFEQHTPLLNYSGGFPPDVVPPAYGLLEFGDPIVVPVANPDSPNVADRHRANVSTLSLIYQS